MIDSSIQLLWEDNLDHAVLAGAYQDPKADSARARRLEVLMSEARTAGTPWTMVARVIADWIGAVEPLLPHRSKDAREARSRLRGELEAAEDLIVGKMPEGPSAIGLSLSSDAAADRLACLLHSVVDCLAYNIDHGTDDGTNPDGIAAWVWSAEALAVIDEVGGALAIDKCAELAYRRLFPRAASDARQTAEERRRHEDHSMESALPALNGL